MELGGIKPGYHNGDETAIWSCPIEVWLRKGIKQLKVVSVYEDEGVLCIDVEESGED